MPSCASQLLLCCNEQLAEAAAWGAGRLDGLIQIAITPHFVQVYDILLVHAWRNFECYLWGCLATRY